MEAEETRRLWKQLSPSEGELPCQHIKLIIGALSTAMVLAIASEENATLAPGNCNSFEIITYLSQNSIW